MCCVVNISSEGKRRGQKEGEEAKQERDITVCVVGVSGTDIP